MMLDIAGWIAPFATMIAAIMTAANLGARVTGWGFVIFTLGAVAWSVEAMLTHQQNLLWSNGFLAIVDAVGVYRWLGRRAALEQGAKTAEAKSRQSAAPLFPVLALEGAPLHDAAGDKIASIVGAMGDCHSGQIAYLVLDCAGTTGEKNYRSIVWEDVECGDEFHTRLSPQDFHALPCTDPADWPAVVPKATS
jgi:hypothetical protein